MSVSSRNKELSAHKLAPRLHRGVAATIGISSIAALLIFSHQKTTQQRNNHR